MNGVSLARRATGFCLDPSCKEGMSQLLQLAFAFLVGFAAGGVRVLGAPSLGCHAASFIGIMYRSHGGANFSIRTEIGVFADGYHSQVLGELIRATDDFDDMGCSLPWKSTSSKPWVALVRRGGCSIQTKVENALIQNASGIIIYNNRDSLNLYNIKLTTKYRGLISVVFTYKWKGEELVNLLDSGTKVIVELSVAKPCVIINVDHERNMQLLCVSFLCFIVLTISLAWLIFYNLQRYRDLQVRERKARGYSDADEKALKAIPTKVVKANDKLIKDESECCAICIDPYRPSEVVRTLVCNHEFHKTCIDPWLLEHRTCPMCKKDILKLSGSVFTGSQESILQVIAEEATRLAGPSSPEIQVIILSESLDESNRVPSPPAPDDSNDEQILTDAAGPSISESTPVNSSAFIAIAVRRSTVVPLNDSDDDGSDSTNPTGNESVQITSPQPSKIDHSIDVEPVCVDNCDEIRTEELGSHDES